jgi:hypothetical protein
MSAAVACCSVNVTSESQHNLTSNCPAKSPCADKGCVRMVRKQAGQPDSSCCVPVEVCTLLRNICFGLNQLLQLVQQRPTVDLSTLCLQDKCAHQHNILAASTFSYRSADGCCAHAAARTVVET